MGEAGEGEGEGRRDKMRWVRRPRARFSKLPVITGPIKLFCFPFQMGVSEGLKIMQQRYQLEKKMDFIRAQNRPYFSSDFDFKI